MKFKSIHAAIAASTILIVGTACSAIFSPEEAQCATTADCTARGPAFAGLTCNTKIGVCEKVGCASNAECTAANGGQPFVCNHAEPRACVSLQRADDAGAAFCTPHANPEDITNEDTIWIGTIAAATGPIADVGSTRANMIELARDQIRSSYGGLPEVAPGQPKRPLGYVSCETGANPQAAVAAAKYLVEELGAPAIIGPESYEEHVAIANEVYSKKRVLAFPGVQSPRGGMPAAGDPRAVWTPITSLDNWGKMFANAANTVYEPQIRNDLALATSDSVRVAVVSANYEFYKQTYEQLAANLKINGKSVAQNGAANFFFAEYTGFGQASAAEYEKLQNDLIAFKPHLIIALGAAEVGGDIVGATEGKWPSAVPKPQWMLSILSFGAPLVGALSNPAFMLPPRVTWFNADYVNDATNTLAVQYQLKFNPPPQAAFIPLLTAAFVAAPYDLMYGVAYTIAQNGAAPLTGENLINAFLKIKTPTGTPVQTGTGDLFSGMSPFQPGKTGSISLNGAVMKFTELSPETGRVEKAQFELQCLEVTIVDGAPAAAPAKSGVSFDPTTFEAKGTIGCGRPPAP